MEAPKENRPELAIFVGLQGSGKSTYFASRFRETHQLVSKDLMSRNARNKSERQERQVREALMQERSVVVDNTNPSRQVREPLIRMGQELGARIVAYYFVPDFVMSLERNRLRQGRARVPDIAIHATRKLMEAPSFEEGFERIYAVRLEEGGFQLTERERSRPLPATSGHPRRREAP